ncbi:MAG TPA: NifU family protein [Anaerolineales bacterium]|nr:NifU family protein [Anaerolineales bacterium]
MVEHNHELADANERMKALIENISAYIEQYHGGSVKMVSFNGEVLDVELGGACQGCPLTETTLQGWVAGTVRQFFPDVKKINAV